MRCLLSSIMVLWSVMTYAGTPVKVGLFYGANHVRATFSVNKGSYSVVADGVELFTISSGINADITASSGKVNVFYNGKNYAGNTRLTFVQTVPSEFKVTPAGTKATGRVYLENMIALAYSGRLQLVNELDVEDYIPGVIEAESGSKKELEYYKVQAVISRTYVLDNLGRHNGEGFQICDATHCQVFHGKARFEPLATVATQATEDIVIVDSEINLITAAFHSNCGGHTINSEDVWQKPKPYLIGVQDTFCLKMPCSNWEKTITHEKWMGYLKSKRGTPSTDLLASNIGYYPAEKQTFFVDSALKIPLRTMREDLKLRSTYFAVQSDGVNVVFTGQGFGHGVGLCQEGGMRMAQLGKSYKEIIHFYYKDVHLIPRSMMWFFRE